VQPVRDAAETATTADGAPRGDLQDDVDPVTAQPRTFVEAVRRPPRPSRDGDQVQDGALRRGATER
jgi:hypothetical protein